MTEEEKKAIEYFKKSFISKTPPYWYDDTIENSEIKIKTLVNLIEKLQKENERKDCKILNLAEENTRLHKEINERVKLKIENEKIVDEEFIPKDKIRVILEDEIEDAEIIYHIKELLEEE